MSAAPRGMSLRSRIAAAIGVTTFLVLAGTGAGYAYWTASGQVAATAQATTATVGLTVPAGLTATYTTTSTGPVIGELALANTGGAPLTLSLTASATNAALAGQISLRTWLRVGSSCGASVPATGVTTGTLAAPPALPSGAGSAAASTSVAVCAATSFTGTYSSYQGQTTTVTLTLTGAVGTNWRPTATATFTQRLQAVSSFDSNARYNIFNANICVAGKDGTVVRNGVCDFNNLGQFRITDAGNGASYISAAMNAQQQPTAPRWSLASATADVALVTPSAVDAQRWTITQRADGRYRLQNIATGLCAQVSTTQLWGSSGGEIIRAATCNDSLASQGFTFTLVNTTAPPAVTLTCTGNGTNFINYSWPVLTGYQAEVVYKVYVGGVFVADHTNGWSTSVNLYRDSTPQVPVATLGAGLHTVEVRQSVAGGAWTVTGTGTMRIAAGTNNLTCS